MTRQSSISYVRYELVILLTLVKIVTWSKHLIGRSSDISIHFSIFVIRLVQQHVKKKLKTKT